MKQRVLSAALALCLCLSAAPKAYAQQDALSPQMNLREAKYTAEPAPQEEVKIPAQQEVYAAFTALKEQERYKEGAAWTNETHIYSWKGGTQDGIAATGAGCVAFAYELSDAAFGSLPARMFSTFAFSDVKVGDILMLDSGAHTVIVLQVSDVGVVIAEGNYNSQVHWGRSLGIADVEGAVRLITRYPEGYVPPDDPSANETAASGTLTEELDWKLTKAGTLTISGSGAMPDFAGPTDGQPWNEYADNIQSIVIENGVTSVGASAFYNSKAISVTIPASVTAIGSSAFYGSLIISVTIPANVKTISNDAFHGCLHLGTVTVSEGVENIGERAFYGCTTLKSISLPASVTAVGSGAFFNCSELTQAAFAPKDETVQLGDDLFGGCWRLASVTLPVRADCIGARMFQNCYAALSSLTIPQDAASIGEGAFASCSCLASIAIPASIKTIGQGAFAKCGVTDIYFGGSKAEWEAIPKIGDTQNALSSVTIHYNSIAPDPGPGHTHTWDSGEVTKEPACTEDGIRKFGCTELGCGETKTETIPALGHDYGAWQTVIQATTTSSGLQERCCNRCGDKQTKSIPPIEMPVHTHSYGAPTVTKAATCTEPGVRTFTCSCGNTRTETIPAAGHSYSPATVIREASCTEPGEQASACSRCGDIKTETIPAAGHSYGPVTVIKEVSCTEDGQQTSTCSKCGDTLAETVHATGHSFVLNADGDYECSNERNAAGNSATVVNAIVADGYKEVKMQDWLTAAYACQTAASASRYVSGIIHDTLASISNLLSYTINTITYTPPTQIADGEYIYTVTLRFNGRAAAAILTTEPLHMVLPADASADPNPIPDPAPDSDREETYYIFVPQSTGGEVIPTTRHAAQGERVPLAVHPDAGFELSELAVSDIRGRNISVRDLGDNCYSFTMPGSRVEINAVFTAVTTEAGQTAPDDEVFTGLGTPGISGIILNPASMPFTDVPASSWYYNSVDYVWKHYLMSGVSDTQFAPDQTTSRAMIWTILARTHNVRTDVNPGSTWYEKGMLWAIEQGVTDGSSPMDSITREQLAVMLWRNAGSMGGGSLSQFRDAASISGYAVSAVQWAVSRGILRGSSGQLNPKGTATRAEVAAMIMRYAEAG